MELKDGLELALTITAIGCGIAGTTEFIISAKHKREVASEERKHRYEKEQAEFEERRKYNNSISSEDKAKIEIEKEKTKQLAAQEEIEKAKARQLWAQKEERVTDIKEEIKTVCVAESMSSVKEKTKKMYDDWVDSYERRVDRKIDSLESRVDKLLQTNAEKSPKESSANSSSGQPTIVISNSK